MSSINFSEVYSSFFTKVEAYDLFDPNLSENTRGEFLCGWLESAVSDPYIMNLFSSISVTNPDVSQGLDGVIDYELKYKAKDKDAEKAEKKDKRFVKEVLGYSMALAWATPKVNSFTNLSQLITDGQTKFYSQSNHVSAIVLAKDDLEHKRNHLIAMRGVANNTYLDGTSPIATSRKQQ